MKNAAGTQEFEIAISRRIAASIARVIAPVIVFYRVLAKWSALCFLMYESYITKHSTDQFARTQYELFRIYAYMEELNTRGVVKYSDFGPINGYISETVQHRR